MAPFGIFLLFDILSSKNYVFFQPLYLESLVHSDEQMQQWLNPSYKHLRWVD